MSVWKPGPWCLPHPACSGEQDHAWRSPEGDTQGRHQQGTGTLGRGCPQPHQGAGGKSPTRGWGCTERDLAAGGCGEGSGDPGPGDKRGDKVSRKEENGDPCLGVIGNRVPLLPGGPCGGAELSEKYPVAHLGVQERL